MKKELNKLNFVNAKNKLISNVTAKEINDKEELKDLLIKQIENRVRWRESIKFMIKKVLNNLLKLVQEKFFLG